MNEQLKNLYKKMSDLTLPKCKSCAIPLSCCSPEYCQMAIENARDKWGVKLKVTEHPTLPLMGKQGCTASPHFRPLCTLHTCKINALGFDPDAKWTDEYFELREEIAELEAEKM